MPAFTRVIPFSICLKPRPMIFSLLLDLSGSYPLAFVTISALTALGAMVLLLRALKNV